MKKLFKGIFKLAVISSIIAVAAKGFQKLSQADSEEVKNNVDDAIDGSVLDAKDKFKAKAHEAIDKSEEVIETTEENVEKLKAKGKDTADKVKSKVEEKIDK